MDTRIAKAGAEWKLFGGTWQAVLGSGRAVDVAGEGGAPFSMTAHRRQARDEKGFSLNNNAKEVGGRG